MKFHAHICDLPTYEVGKPLELVMREYGIATNEIIKLGSNENPFGVSPKAKETIIQNAHLASVYPDDSYYELKESLSQHYNIAHDNIIIGNGSDQIIEFCIYALCDSNTRIVTAKTTFAMYDIYAKHCNARILKTPDFSHNLDSMLMFYKKYKPTIIFLCTPNNPLGEALKKQDILSFLSKINEDCLVVLDCAYMEYCIHKNNEYAIYPQDIIHFSNVIYLGTFSKLYGLGGMRIGYGIANASVIANLHKLRPPFNITTLSLKAAVSSLKDVDFVEKSLHNNFIEMQKYQNFAFQYSIEFLESYANFITFLLHNKLNSTKIGILLLQEGIVVRDLASYGLNAIRITIGTPKQNEIVFKKLAAIIEKQRSME